MDTKAATSAYVGERVRIPVYTDRWMMGDTHGTITKTRHGKSSSALIAHVKLDVSGKTIQVLFDDCKVVS